MVLSSACIGKQRLTTVILPSSDLESRSLP